MTLTWTNKDPDDILDYVLDWSDFLGVDTIAGSTWVMPTGITKDSSSFTSTATTIWLSGGTIGTQYTIINRITTAAGRQKDQSVAITIKTN